jgi:hypothetical protein
MSQADWASVEASSQFEESQAEEDARWEESQVDANDPFCAPGSIDGEPLSRTKLKFGSMGIAYKGYSTRAPVRRQFKALVPTAPYSAPNVCAPLPSRTVRVQGFSALRRPPTPPHIREQPAGATGGLPSLPLHFGPDEACDGDERLLDDEVVVVESKSLSDVLGPRPKPPPPLLTEMQEESQPSEPRPKKKRARKRCRSTWC